MGSLEPPEQELLINTQIDDEVDQDDVVVTSEPVDRFSAVLALFSLLGIATLLPWNFFITANNYWMYKLRDLSGQSPDTVLTPLQLGFTSHLCVASLVPSTIVLLIHAAIGHHSSFRLRIAGGLAGTVAFFTLTTALVKINTDTWQEGFYALTLITVCTANS